MKKQMLFLLSISVMAVYSPLYAESSLVEKAIEVPDLSIDEKVFVAKLSDENRRIFIHLEKKQRESIITAVKNGLDPDKAVQHLIEPMSIENCAVDMKLSK
ncbi:hypothetical protein RHABOEDO_000300 [Candidatus Rhabdochlamydia oedothoracis]|uniref:Secreted protein n=1 Tax=Candidatus Rhabdochlamydia oedothoracis TaxID=2720720 RepID=A0ABX8V4N9_9BACT|nr:MULTISPECIES: hypothetical protein [Rhabdochlamydia]KAG6559622.1 hypothetical protein RHOW815_000338 [Candidatus Rhabdochlamydia sp. W815]MCL6756454.1 hypothetical protein [Candidatus Rhabdochlamydia oedothoracis]QYF48189.1 hypothetical protein RHABOEDO_000300 [Candidatus Rhabdochlamydia oedothoracis]